MKIENKNLNAKIVPNSSYEIEKWRDLIVHKTFFDGDPFLRTIILLCKILAKDQNK